MMIDENTLSSIIGEFSALYGGEVNVFLESFERDRFVVKFTGRLCKECGVEEYFDALAYMLRLGGINARMINYKEENNAYLVTYSL